MITKKSRHSHTVNGGIFVREIHLKESVLRED